LHSAIWPRSLGKTGAKGAARSAIGKSSLSTAGSWLIALDCTPIALEDAPLEDAGRANRGGQADHGSKQDPGREVGRRGSLLQDLDRTPGGLRTPALPDVDVHNTDDMHDDAALNEEVAQALGRYEERVYTGEHCR